MFNRILVYIFSLVVLLISFSSCKSDGNADTTAPLLISSNPANGATAVDPKAVISFNYNDKIVLSPSAPILLNGAAITGAVSAQTLTVSATLQSGTTYTLIIPANAISDVSGNYAKEIKITFTTIKVQESVSIAPDLVTLNPSSQAVKLYNFLKENYGVKTISSTMANVNWNINEAEWVKLQSGKYPAMATFDYIHLMSSPASWIDYSNISIIEDWWNNNGIVSAGWHWNVPTSPSATDYTYDPDKTTFKASNATIDGTWENGIVQADLKKISGYLKLLQAKNIPVIWRPLHEGAGNIYMYSGGKAWFWWGASGADAYKALWIYMFNYFKNQGINNLIWVWTTQTNDNAFYPGDNYVDIIGRDIYNKTTTTFFSNEFTTIQNVYTHKLITLSELGNVSQISDQWTAGAKWSYFMPWYDYDRTKDVSSTDFTSPEHQHANASWWKNAFNSDYVISRDKMPSLK